MKHLSHWERDAIVVAEVVRLRGGAPRSLTTSATLDHPAKRNLLKTGDHARSRLRENAGVVIHRPRLADGDVQEPLAVVVDDHLARHLDAGDQLLVVGEEFFH